MHSVREWHHFLVPDLPWPAQPTKPAQTSPRSLPESHSDASQMPPGCLPDAFIARSPQPGCHNQDCTAWFPQPRFHSQDSTARIPQPGFHHQDSTARIPQPGFHNQDYAARITLPGLRCQDYATRITQPGLRYQDYAARITLPGLLSQDWRRSGGGANCFWTPWSLWHPPDSVRSGQDSEKSVPALARWYFFSDL